MTFRLPSISWWERGHQLGWVPRAELPYIGTQTQSRASCLAQHGVKGSDWDSSRTRQARPLVMRVKAVFYITNHYFPVPVTNHFCKRSYKVKLHRTGPGQSYQQLADIRCLPLVISPSCPLEVGCECETLLQPREREWHVTSSWKQMLVLGLLLCLPSGGADNPASPSI